MALKINWLLCCNFFVFRKRKLFPVFL